MKLVALAIVALVLSVGVVVQGAVFPTKRVPQASPSASQSMRSADFASTVYVADDGAVALTSPGKPVSSVAVRLLVPKAGGKPEVSLNSALQADGWSFPVHQVYAQGTTYVVDVAAVTLATAGYTIDNALIVAHVKFPKSTTPASTATFDVSQTHLILKSGEDVSINVKE